MASPLTWKIKDDERKLVGATRWVKDAVILACRFPGSRIHFRTSKVLWREERDTHSPDGATELIWQRLGWD